MNIGDTKFTEYHKILTSFTESQKFDFYDGFLLGYIVAKYNYNMKSCLELLTAIKDYRNDKQHDTSIVQLALFYIYVGQPDTASLLIARGNKNIRLPEVETKEVKTFQNPSKIQVSEPMIIEEQKVAKEVKKPKYSQQVPPEFVIEDHDSIKLAKQLQIEELKEQERRRLELEKANVSQCAICMDEIIEINELLPLYTCGHVFHSACIKQYIEMKVKDRAYPILCPDTTCKLPLSNYDIQFLLDPNVLNEYFQGSFNKFVENNMSDYSYCPTPDCRYIFIFEQKNDPPDFTCPVCSKRYCLNCKTQYHINMTCEEYRISHSHTKEDQKFEKFVKGKKYKQCPGCKIWVEKIEGCDFISCRCGMSFCYNCGGDKTKCKCASKAGGHFRGPDHPIPIPIGGRLPRWDPARARIYAGRKYL